MPLAQKLTFWEIVERTGRPPSFVAQCLAKLQANGKAKGYVPGKLDAVIELV